MVEQIINNAFAQRECEISGLKYWQSGIRETYGQHGEDIIADSLLRVQLYRSGRNFDQLSYIEIGANHPVIHSSSYYFYRNYGARGVLVEPIPSLCEDLARHRPGDRIVNCVISASHEATATLYVTQYQPLSSLDRRHIEQFAGEGSRVAEELVVRNLHINSFLENHAPERIDFLCVDCEGADLEILAAMDMQRFRPILIQCEASGEMMPFIDLFKARDYVFMATTDVNAFFVDAFAVLGLR